MSTETAISQFFLYVDDRLSGAIDAETWLPASDLGLMLKKLGGVNNIGFASLEELLKHHGSIEVGRVKGGNQMMFRRKSALSRATPPSSSTIPSRLQNISSNLVSSSSSSSSSSSFNSSFNSSSFNSSSSSSSSSFNNGIEYDTTLSHSSSSNSNIEGHDNDRLNTTNQNPQTAIRSLLLNVIWPIGIISLKSLETLLGAQ